MKRILAAVLTALLAFGLIPITASGVSSYNVLKASKRFDWQNPRPQGNSLQAVDFVTDTLGWAVGVNGTVIKTADGGFTWTQQGPITPQGAESTVNDCRDVCFVDATHGWTIAGEYVYRTTDGGTTWSDISPMYHDGGGYLAWQSIDFADANSGWVVGQATAGGGTYIFHTADGGASWTEQHDPTAAGFTQVAAASPNTAYASGYFGGYLKTTNAGASWTQQLFSGTAHDADWTDSIAAANISHVYVATGGDVLRTSTGGSSWTTMTVDNGSDPVEHVCALKDGAGADAWAFTDVARAYRTSDSGATTWTAGGFVSGGLAVDPDATSISGLFVVGDAGVMASTDGGDSWAPRFEGVGVSGTESVDFVDALNGAAVGGSDYWSTADGGSMWTMSQPFGSLYARDIFFLESNPQTGWVVGYPAAGTPSVYKTINGGANWASQPETDMAASQVCFPDANNGWANANGEWGHFWHTTDGGANWTDVMRDGFYWDVDFVDTDHGWFALDLGDDKNNVLHTADGGSSWTTQTVPASGGSIYQLDFVDASYGWCADSFGYIYKTTNGGATWSAALAQSPGATVDIKDIKFTSRTEGWIVGEQWTSSALSSYRHDFAAYTKDGGATWDYKYNPTGADKGSTGTKIGLNAVDSIDGENCWVVGGEGGILKGVAAAEPLPPDPDPSPTTTDRISGKDRYDVATDIARESFPGWTGVKHVVIASGEDRASADPLSAGGLVWTYDAPLFLVNSNSTPAGVKAALKEIVAKNGKITVHVVGGTVSVPPARISDIKAAVGSANVVEDRVKPNGNRYDLAAAIARRAAAKNGGAPIACLIANGADDTKFFDALALSAISANKGAPILLVSKDAVPAATDAALKQFKAVNSAMPVVVGGGPATVSESVRKKVGGQRWSGSDRFSTATTIGTKAIGKGWLAPTSVGVAAKLPDALAGGAFIGHEGGVLLLTQTNTLPSATGSWISYHKSTITDSYVFGGPASVSNTVKSQIDAKLK